jgi:hypothetical protein
LILGKKAAEKLIAKHPDLGTNKFSGPIKAR